MSWDCRDEASATCPGPYGPVTNNEQVSRLLIRRTKEPLNWTPFNQKDLYPIAPNIDNACGTERGQDGCSVDRFDHLDPTAVIARSDQFAAHGKNRVGHGALVANVGEIRSITAEDTPELPAFRIYDDSIQTNPEHAVIRGCLHVPIEERPSVVGALQYLFEQVHIFE